MKKLLAIATLVANELIQINAFVNEQGYCELGCGYLWASGLEKALGSELISCFHIIGKITS